MSDLPPHQDTGPAGSDPPIGRMPRLRTVLIAAAVIGLLVLIAVLHLAGVLGGESH
jgi:hypothetical protein